MLMCVRLNLAYCGLRAFMNKQWLGWLWVRLQRCPVLSGNGTRWRWVHCRHVCMCVCPLLLITGSGVSSLRGTVVSFAWWLITNIPEPTAKVHSQQRQKIAVKKKKNQVISPKHMFLKEINTAHDHRTSDDLMWPPSEPETFLLQCFHLPHINSLRGFASLVSVCIYRNYLRTNMSYFICPSQVEQGKHPVNT